MRTRISDFLDTQAMRPVYSFQFYDDSRGCWVYVNDGHGHPATWRTSKERDAARACFTHRKNKDAAVADLKAQRLTHQPA